MKIVPMGSMEQMDAGFKFTFSAEDKHLMSTFIRFAYKYRS